MHQQSNEELYSTMNVKIHDHLLVVSAPKNSNVEDICEVLKSPGSHYNDAAHELLPQRSE